MKKHEKWNVGLAVFSVCLAAMFPACNDTESTHTGTESSESHPETRPWSGPSGSEPDQSEKKSNNFDESQDPPCAEDLEKKFRQFNQNGPRELDRPSYLANSTQAQAYEDAYTARQALFKKLQGLAHSKCAGVNKSIFLEDEKKNEKNIEDNLENARIFKAVLGKIEEFKKLGIKLSDKGLEKMSATSVPPAYSLVEPSLIQLARDLAEWQKSLSQVDPENRLESLGTLIKPMKTTASLLPSLQDYVSKNSSAESLDFFMVLGRSYASLKSKYPPCSPEISEKIIALFDASQEIKKLVATNPKPYDLESHRKIRDLYEHYILINQQLNVAPSHHECRFGEEPPRVYDSLMKNEHTRKFEEYSVEKKQADKFLALSEQLHILHENYGITLKRSGPTDQRNPRAVDRMNPGLIYDVIEEAIDQSPQKHPTVAVIKEWIDHAFPQFQNALEDIEADRQLKKTAASLTTTGETWDLNVDSRLYTMTLSSFHAIAKLRYAIAIETAYDPELNRDFWKMYRDHTVPRDAMGGLLRLFGSNERILHPADFLRFKKEWLKNHDPANLSHLPPERLQEAQNTYKLFLWLEKDYQVSNPFRK